ncbi:beta strand repeat-containing protein, partial [Emticicia agri]
MKKFLFLLLILSTYKGFSQVHSDDPDFVSKKINTYLPTTADAAVCDGLSLVTTYTTNNGSRGIMFDVKATNTLTIKYFDANLYAGTATYEIWYHPGSYLGTEDTPGSWTRIDSVNNIVSEGAGLPTRIPILVDVVIPAGETYAFYITNTVSGGVNYVTTAASGDTLATDINLMVLGGVGKAYPFSTNFRYRNFSGTICYRLGTNEGTTLTSDNNPADEGENVLFTATVLPSSATGTVTFKDGSTTLSTVALSGGIATFSTNTLTVGTHSITATYNGDGTVEPSTSDTLSQVINCLAPTGISVNNTTVCPGSSVLLTATCASGTITWYNQATGGSAIGTGSSLSHSPAVNTTYYTSCESENCVSSRASTDAVTLSTAPSAPTSPTAIPSNFIVSGTTTLTASGCDSPATISWYDTANSTIALPDNTPTIAANKTFFARCTGTNTCISDPSTTVSVTYTPCTPLSTSPGNVTIYWTGAISADWNNPCNWNPAWVPDNTNSAVAISLQSNQPVISGAVPAIKELYVNAGAILTVSNGATLSVSSSSLASITSYGGSIINEGTISTAVSGIGMSIFAGDITNRGTMNLNNSISGIVANVNANATITNESTGIINLTDGYGLRYIVGNLSTITNHGAINYSGLSYALSLNEGTLINDGTITITNGFGISNLNGSGITNNACGKIIMTAGNYDNDGSTTTNAGLIQMPDEYDFANTGTFTNNGVLKANSVTGITNNRMIITNTCAIFTRALANNYTVNGIYTNVAATIQAGTYTSGSNIFVANNTIPSGTQTLYTQVNNGTCTFVVPFIFDNAKPASVLVSQTAICLGNSVSLTASCNTGTITWYKQATGGSTIGTGSPLNQSPTTATTYYASCKSSNCESGRVATSLVTVNSVPPAPIINAPNPKVVCAPGTLTLTTSDCTGTITWSNGSSGTSLTLSTVGTYAISATCTDGSCTSPASAAVTGLQIVAQPAAPTINAPNPKVVCSPNTLTLTGSGCAGTVNWSNGSSGSSLTLSSVGTYSISATCTVGSCISPASVAVTGLQIVAQPSAPTINAPNPKVVCAPSTLTLTASGCGGTVNWSNGSSGTSLTLSIVGTYSITATCTVGSCTSVPSAAVTGLQIVAQPSAPTITAPATKVVCSPSTLTLTASGCDGIVNWSNGSSGTSVVLSSVGTYSITATCTVGSCISPASAAVAGLQIVAQPTAPTITAPATKVVCAPSTLTLTASGCGGTVNWSNGSSGSSLTLSSVGTYSITATCTVGSCISPASAAVTGLQIVAQPTAPTITAPATKVVCAPSTLTLTASGCGGTVNWSNGSSGTSIVLSSVGTYSITATCTVGSCTSPPSPAVTGLQIVSQPSAPTITAPAMKVVCSPSTLTLTASGCAGTVNWSNGSSGTSIVLSSVGTYTITATCTVGSCISPASVAVTGLQIVAQPAAPTITPPGSLVVCAPSTLTLTASGCAGTVNWSNGSSGTSIVLSSVGTYSISATCTVGSCTSPASSTVIGLQIVAQPTAPTITPPGSLVVCAPSTLTLTASGCAGTVNWSNGSSGTSLTLSSVGTYSISATCTVGSCTSPASSTVTGL